MTAVVMEMKVGSGWELLGPMIGPTDPPGSVSSTLGGRQVYVFGFKDGEPGLWRSGGGVDVATIDYRMIHSLGFEKMSDLAEPFAATLQRTGYTVDVRFRLVP